MQKHFDYSDRFSNGSDHATIPGAFLCHKGYIAPVTLLVHVIMLNNLPNEFNGHHNGQLKQVTIQRFDNNKNINQERSFLDAAADTERVRRKHTYTQTHRA